MMFGISASEYSIELNVARISSACFGCCCGVTSCDVGVAADTDGAMLDVAAAELPDGKPPSSPMSKPV